MKKIIFIASIFSLAVFLGGPFAYATSYERLYGTWVAKDVELETSEVKIRLTFKK